MTRSEAFCSPLRIGAGQFRDGADQGDEQVDVVIVVLALQHRGDPLEARAGVKNRIRGWNGAAQDPLVDARSAALDRVRRALPGIPVVLVGHSMGGRVVLRLSDEPDVAGVAALAPWIAGDARLPRSGTPVLLLHGTKDRITDPRRTAALARRFAVAGVDVRHVPIDGGDHPMLRQANRWHDTVADFVREVLHAPGRTS